ncbi:P-loop containing nucleoside triphosphate hydrolase [Gracilaria domingensis]|nr:P-loop containing nucleoside triphosphate hydrolase [Gracilaria domingensis]
MNACRALLARAPRACVLGYPCPGYVSHVTSAQSACCRPSAFSRPDARATGCTHTTAAHPEQPKSATATYWRTLRAVHYCCSDRFRLNFPPYRAARLPFVVGTEPRSVAALIPNSCDMVKNTPVVTLRLSVRELLALTVIGFVFFYLGIANSLRPMSDFPQPLSELNSAQSAANDSALQERHRARLLAELPACATRGRANTFLMFFMGHSGSTAIMTSLKQHSQTSIDGFEPVDHGQFRTGTHEENAEKALNYTSQYFRNASKHGLTSGFKIRPLHLTHLPQQFAALIRNHNTRIIWSYRSNMLKQAIGDYGIYLGDRSAFEGIKVDPNQAAPDRSNRSIYIDDIPRLHRFMKSRVSGDKQVSAALKSVSKDHCVLPVSYESFLKDPELTMLRTQRFLGLNTDELHPSMRAKANPDTICDLVQNWEQLCEAFFGCVQWRWMLDDYENGCSCSSLRPSRFGTKFCSIS